MKPVALILLVTSLFLGSCQTFSARQEFTQHFGARFIPERVVFLDEAEKKTAKGPKVMVTGALSNADDFGRWGIIWAEYGKDYRGDWHRQRHVEVPVSYVTTLEEAKSESDTILARFLNRRD